MISLFIMIAIGFAFAESFESIVAHLRVTVDEKSMLMKLPKAGWDLICAGSILLAIAVLMPVKVQRIGLVGLFLEEFVISGVIFVLVGGHRLYRNRHSKSITNWRDEI